MFVLFKSGEVVAVAAMGIGGGEVDVDEVGRGRLVREELLKMVEVVDGGKVRYCRSGWMRIEQGEMVV